jgi:hypothetical protein
MTTLRTLIRSSVLLSFTALGAAACGNDAESGGANTVQGTLVGTPPAPASKIVVVWSVSSGSPDYVFKFGEGSVTGAKYVVSLERDPPAEAINRYGIGIGMLALVDAQLSIPEGKVDEATVDAVLGVSRRHAVIWRAEGAQDLSWSGAFPRGYSCGRCVDAPEGEIFDSFEPVECTGIEIQVGEIDDVCNWT